MIRKLLTVSVVAVIVAAVSTFLLGSLLVSGIAAAIALVAAVAAVVLRLTSTEGTEHA